MTATERLLDALREHGATVRTTGRQHTVTCPAHADSTPSLSVTEGESRVLVRCHADCDTDDVLAALGMTRADLFDEPRQHNGSAAAAAYRYLDEDGRLLFEVVRKDGKRFHQRRPDGAGGWVSNLHGVRRVLYQLPQVLDAVRTGTTVYVVEGEKDADRLASAGVVATTSPGGAGKWRPEYGDTLAGASVVVVADRDAPGMAHAKAVAADLAGKASSVQVVQAVEGKDAADHLAAGHGVDDFEPVELDSEEDDLHALVRQRFPRLDFGGLLAAGRPRREWVLDGLVPAGASVALVAPAGSWKSLLLLALMLSVARGDRHFAGLRVTSRRVLLVDMENTEDDLSDRLQALGVTPENASELADLIPIHLPPLAPLDTAVGGAELASILDAYDVQPGDVVALDSLQRVINGAENDSDTMRAYYRHTAVMLKRRGVTVIRTDNTGKDTDRGARGTSGKRDDVDVELILTADADKPGRLHIKPGKSRLPGIQPVLVQAHTDDDGHLTFSTAGDPFRAAVTDAVAILDNLEVPVDWGLNRTFDTVKAAGHKVTRDVMRAAVKDRRTALDVRGISPVPNPYRTAPPILTRQ